MKKLLSLALALLLVLGLCGCVDATLSSAPQSTASTPEPLNTQPAEKVVIPYLIGQHIDALSQTDDYVVVESDSIHSSYEKGTIVSQEPEGGAWVDKGTTVYVVTSLDQVAGSEVPPEVTEPFVTEPHDWEQDRPQVDDPTQDVTEPQPTDPPETEPPETEPSYALDPNGSYTTKNDVALYIHLYGKLPKNFITKSQAESRYGWDGGSLSKYGLCIGGDRFYNNEGKLPSGYTYYECDIDTLYSSKRGAKRLVFTYSGRIYYTSDHYKTFTRLY